MWRRGPPVRLNLISLRGSVVQKTRNPEPVKALPSVSAEKHCLPSVRTPWSQMWRRDPLRVHGMHRRLQDPEDQGVEGVVRC